MKENTLIEMKNTIESQGRVIRSLLAGYSAIRDTQAGMLELTKMLPGYEEAFAILKEQSEKASDDEPKLEL